MSTGISPENETFIQQQLERGAFVDRGELLNAGVDVLRQREALIERLQRAQQQLERGEYTVYDDEGLRKRFEQLKQLIQQEMQAPARNAS